MDDFSSSSNTSPSLFFKPFGERSKGSNYDWYHCHLHIPQLFCSSAKSSFLFSFTFTLWSAGRSKIHRMISSLVVLLLLLLLLQYQLQLEVNSVCNVLIRNVIPNNWCTYFYTLFSVLLWGRQINSLVALSWLAVSLSFCVGVFTRV